MIMSCVHFILACLSLCKINNCNIWPTVFICFVKLKTWWFQEKSDKQADDISSYTKWWNISWWWPRKILTSCDVSLEILPYFRQPHRRNCSATRPQISIFPEGRKSYRCGGRGRVWLCQHGWPRGCSRCNFVSQWAMSSFPSITCWLLRRVQTILDI